MIRVCNGSSQMKPNANSQIARAGGHGYERTDVEIKWVVLAVVLLALGGLLLHFALGALLSHFKNERTKTETTRGGSVNTAIAATRMSFPEPRLQISAERDLAELRAREDLELNSYGWIDKRAGLVRIPIDRAMELILKQGLPNI